MLKVKREQIDELIDRISNFEIGGRRWFVREGQSQSDEQKADAELAFLLKETLLILREIL